MRQGLYSLPKMGLFLLTCIVLSYNKAAAGENESLFTIFRSKDGNEIHYDLNKSGTSSFDKLQPINIHWLKCKPKTHIEPLTWIQRNYAYGIKYLYVHDTEACFQFVSYSKRKLYLRKNASGSYHVYTQSSGKLMKIEKIFIQIDGGTFWFPNISRVEVYAIDETINKRVIEVIKP